MLFHASPSSPKGCGVILRVVKSRLPLLQAGKILYGLSKDTANDTLFRKERLLEPLIRTVRGCWRRRSGQGWKRNLSCEVAPKQGAA